MQFKYFFGACFFSLMASATFAATPEAPPDDTKMNLWIPGFLVKMAAEIAEDHVDGEERVAVDFVKKIGNINICIREGEHYQAKTDKKVMRKLNRMEKKEYEELVSVFTEDEKVNISIKENKKGKIKRLVVLVDEKDETFVYLKMNCRIKPEDITMLTDTFAGDIDF